ncbi:M15 family metallopeptidase [Paenibacillus xanthanilyticus]|uniref:M15 family metallopeptidase n=1 Tax=Paenibacillus xanthanilyticus TaxID=1783531 RepID=A0ABV8K5H0_9BACL
MKERVGSMQPIPQHVIPHKPKKKKKRPIRRFMLWFAFLVLLTAVIIECMPVEIVRHPEPITGLHPEVAAKAHQLKEAGKKRGITIRITDDFRSAAEQDALYRKGRETPGSIVTNVKGGHSYHNYGLAVDFAIETGDGEIIWDLDYDGNRDGQSDWMEIVWLAKSLGFSWGGDWESFPDYPHLQMDFGLSIRELRQGKRPPMPTDEH